MSLRTPRRLRRLATTLTAALATLGLTLSTASAASAQEFGIDVSKWQHNPSINWTAVKNDGVKFAFIKATEGSGYTSAPFKADWNATKNVGIYRGAYHFARPGTNPGDAAAEARYFVSVAGKHQGRGDLPPVLDLESSGGLGVTALRAWTKTWLTTVENLTGRTPIIYASPAFWEHYLGNSRDFTRYPLWVAHYRVSAPRVPGGWPTWTFWQGSDSGRVAGISGGVDMNAFNGGLRKLKALANITVTSPAPTPAPSPAPAPEPAPAPAPEPAPEPEAPIEPEIAPDLTKTTLTLTPTRDRVYRGQATTLTGTLTTDTGDPVASQPVVIRHRSTGSWSKATTVTTDATGTYQATVQATAAADYKAIAHATTTHARAASPLTSVSLTPKTRTRITYTAERSTIKPGRTVRLYGHLTTTAGKPVTGKTVRVLAKRPGTHRWRPVTQATSVAPTGWHQTRVSPHRPMVYKVVYRGALRYTRTATQTKVTVRR